MTLGALCAALACFACLQALVSNRQTGALRGKELIRASTLSPVEWRLHRQAQETWYQRWVRPFLLVWGRKLRLRPSRVDPNFLTQAGLDEEQVDGLELRTIRLMSAFGGMALGGLLGAFVAGTLTVVPLFGWIGYILPIRVLTARRRRRQADVLRELPEFISMVRAFLAVGMSLERTLHALSAAGSPDNPLKQEIRRALGRYGLGLSIDQALEEVGPRTGVDDLAMLITALNQGKRAGTGLDSVLHDQELMVRMNQRNRVTAQAAAVGTKLLGVLAGIYLPEFVILIVIPLFWGIMQRAFG
jgi:Flp pilus assembly protein TadB